MMEIMPNSIPIRTALIICPDEEGVGSVNRSLLGLTIGQRLMLSLEAGGITRVAFIGAGEKPRSNQAKIDILFPEEVRFDPGEVFVVVPCDLVFDRNLLSHAESIPKELPIRRLPVSKWNNVISTANDWMKKTCSGAAETGSDFAIRVVDDETAALAERSLLLSLKKSADGVISRNINRKISTAISRQLARYPIRPNHVTAVVFLVGVMSGPFAWLGTYTGFALGGFCYWFSAVLDGCDGEISRLKYQGSPLGAWLDTIVDDLVCLSYIVGMYMALSRNAEHSYWFWIGIVAITFYLATLLPRYYIMAFYSGSGDYQKMAADQRPVEISIITKLSLATRDVVFRTDFLPFYAMVTALVGFVPAFAAPFAIGTIASAIDSIVSLLKYKKQSTAPH
jgi:phosphatidylglycerophosphate synthase